MSAAAVLREAAAAGVTLSLSGTGTIKAAGERDVVDRWLVAIRTNKAGIVALLAGNDDAANDSARKAWRWLIHFADRNPLEVAFSPALSHAEVLASYPDALAAEPFEEDHHESF